MSSESVVARTRGKFITVLRIRFIRASRHQKTISNASVALSFLQESFCRPSAANQIQFLFVKLPGKDVLRRAYNVSTLAIELHFYLVLKIGFTCDNVLRRLLESKVCKKRFEGFYWRFDKTEIPVIDN